MAWGLWKKIKSGVRKAGNWLKKAAGVVNEKVIKPFKPIIGGIVNSFVPGAGKYVDTVSDGLDAVSDGGVKGAIEWGRKTFR